MNRCVPEPFSRPRARRPGYDFVKLRLPAPKFPVKEPRLIILSVFLATAPGFWRSGDRLLPGETRDEIVLSAPAGDASARAIVLAAVADLRRTPLRHTVRIALRGGGRGPDVGRPVLARLDVEGTGGAQNAGPVIAVSAGTPGWLVHALLRSGEAVGLIPAVTDRRLPFLGQLVARSGTALRGPGREVLPEPEIPTVALSGHSLLTTDAADAGAAPELWAQGVAAAVRRLDALAGRPRPEDQYLVFGGRVWLRRDLIWVGFLIWSLLVFRGLPGRWRGTSAAAQGQQMRTYLPGFLFRALLLAAVFLTPVFAVLLLPAALLALLPPRSLSHAWTRGLCLAAGLLPFGAYLTALVYALVAGKISLEGGLAGGAAAGALIPAALLAYGFLIARGP